jgi:hypothetical protein
MLSAEAARKQGPRNDCGGNLNIGHCCLRGQPCDATINGAPRPDRPKPGSICKASTKRQAREECEDAHPEIGPTPTTNVQNQRYPPSAGGSAIAPPGEYSLGPTRALGIPMGNSSAMRPQRRGSARQPEDETGIGRGDARDRAGIDGVRPAVLRQMEQRIAPYQRHIGTQQQPWGAVLADPISEPSDSNSRSLREGKGYGQPLQASIAVSDLNL